ncbi:unnamed protein product [Didymodactylos carnosus]|uniref:ADP-ribosylation factor GTPase-activating protein 2 n=1 Tax=Didymodactylos carnosus TaxID=1234261 RepID=A0A8S2IH48_9BILA|nr:unnamed protein product [Didymodactylos carnosus]CAF3754580.1 unnamed protein product [Didymodactylos carnosus]
MSIEEPTKADIDTIFKRLKTIPANKEMFFQQHGCHSKDIQQKYNSRASQLYREKLHQLSTKAMKMHGTKLIIDDAPKSDQTHSSTDKKEGDFFHEHSQSLGTTGNRIENNAENYSLSLESSDPNIDQSDQFGEGPSIDPNVFSADGTQKTLDPKKSTIGQRRPAPSKKKGFGAQKVVTDFKEIERNVQEQEKMKEIQTHQEIKSREENEKQIEKQMASLKFAYQDINKQREVEEAKLKQSNPKKAEQLERLGMGFSSRSGVSHSAMTDMQTIQQEGVTTTRNVSLAPRNRDFFDEFDVPSFSSRSKLDDDLFKPKPSKNDTFGSDWEVIDQKVQTKDMDLRTYASDTISGFRDVPRSNDRTPTPSSPVGNDAQKRFTNAKAISSDQYFNKDNDNDRSNIISRFGESKSISSADYFGDPQSKSQQRGGGNGNYQGPDLATMKADFKDGVSKVAGRLSTMASNVMSTIQDRY